MTKGPLGGLVLALVAAAIGVGAYLWWPSAPVAPASPPPAQPPVAPRPAVKPAPQVQYPVPLAGDASGLPALDQSDSSLRKLLAELFGRTAFEQFFAQQDIVRRIVATVDNLAREKAAQRLMPVRAAAGLFLVTGEGEARAISPKNAARYVPFLAMAEAADTARLVAAYVRNYPLFQQAYRELGYPNEYFNDRLVQVIDHLLTAPEPEAPVKLVQRKVLYEYADPELEARSAGHKILMRMGTENAARAKAKLRELRGALTRAPAKT